MIYDVAGRSNGNYESLVGTTSGRILDMTAKHWFTETTTGASGNSSARWTCCRFKEVVQQCDAYLHCQNGAPKQGWILSPGASVVEFCATSSSFHTSSAMMTR